MGSISIIEKIKQPACKVKIIQYTLITIFVIPLGVYFYKFHGSLSNDFNNWGAFGSYLAGVYSLLVSLITLRIISQQFLLQREQNKFQQDESYLQNIRQDINFFLEKITILLHEKIYNHDKNNMQRLKEIGEILIFNSEDKNTIIGILEIIYEHRNHDISKEIFELTQQNYSLIQINSIWGQINSFLSGLKTGDKQYKYLHNFSCGKLQAILSYRVCVYLDYYNYIWANKLNNNYSIQYEFLRNSDI